MAKRPEPNVYPGVGEVMRYASRVNLCKLRFTATMHEPYAMHLIETVKFVEFTSFNQYLGKALYAFMGYARAGTLQAREIGHRERMQYEHEETLSAVVCRWEDACRNRNAGLDGCPYIHLEAYGTLEA